MLITSLGKPYTYRTIVNISFLRSLIVSVLVLILSACEPVKKEPPIEPLEPVSQEPEKPVFSAEPIIPAKPDDIKFAQHALNELGFKVGMVDGLWGPRSANGIRQFETQHDLITANGHLSLLNLHFLEQYSGVSRVNFGKTPLEEPLGVTAKLDPTTPLREGPQLIIVDKSYQVLSKPNPYSSVVLKLAPGTGIYVIAKQDGYFEIESINRRKGFIEAD